MKRYGKSSWPARRHELTQADRIDLGLTDATSHGDLKIGDVVTWGSGPMSTPVGQIVGFKEDGTAVAAHRYGRGWHLLPPGGCTKINARGA